MKRNVFIAIFCFGLILSTQVFGQSNNFLKRFETFVESVEKQESIHSKNWDSLNTQYKDFRTEYKTSCKDKFTSEQVKQYNELKARYIKQVTIKKVGKSVQKGVESTTGFVKGIFKKSDKKKN